MDFFSQVEEVFDIDIWELKPQYKNNQPNKTTNNEKNNNGSLQLIYSNNITRSKIVNFLMYTDINLNFIKNIANSLFYNSKVNIYKLNDNSFVEIKGINISEKDLFIDRDNFLSIKNKKHILSKLYKYADFSCK
ncbi:MAG: hypothetical protein Kow0076_7100 [Francisella sp.]